MAAITSVEIENFRCFKKLRVDGFTAVNLIVGANNAGKTALLEAIEAVVSEHSPFLLYRASTERSEYRRRRHGDEDFVELDVRHWFHGHVLAAGASYMLRASGDRTLEVSRNLEAVSLPATSPAFIPGGLQITTHRASTPLPLFPLNADGYLGAGAPTSFQDFGLRLNPAVGFIGTNRLSPRKLAVLWAKIVLTPGERHVVDALRLIEPTIDRIAISESDDTIAKVLLRGASLPIPLGTLGEGVTRILTLALHLASTQSGYLFVDEIENGLHWSAIPKVWRFLVETARATNTQVFAVTHSKDWLEGLAELHRVHPALAEDVSVHRLEAGRETAIRFDASRIAELIEMDLEAR